MFWRLFTAKPPPPDIPNHVIIDRHTGERFDIDNDYCALGESEGWLRFTGLHNIGGVLYFEWEHTA